MRRVMFALFATAGLLAALIYWLGSGAAGLAAGRGAVGVFVSVLMVGLPALYYCCRTASWESWRFVVVGGLAGFLCVLPLAGGPHHFGLAAVLFTLGGAVWGAIFWLAAIWRNRKLNCPKSICLPCGTVYRVARDVLGRQSK
ncbi:MAG: hypothetical protein ACK4E4_02655 [Rhodocyclaceae bacterium]